MKTEKTDPTPADVLKVMQFNSNRKTNTKAYLLLLFLGNFGAHRFYLKHYLYGSLFILLSFSFLMGLLLMIAGEPFIGLFIMVPYFIAYLLEFILLTRAVTKYNNNLLKSL